MGSSADKAQELQESAEKAHESHMAPVSVTISIVAVLVACAATLGHRAHTEEIILQNRVTDQWAYYQAKNIRRSSYELFLDLLRVSEFKDQKTVENLKAKYQSTIEKYAKDQKEIDAEARNLENEVDLQRRRADRFDLGESFLEIGLIVTSITLLTRKRFFWGMGMVAAIIGVVIAALGLMVH
jgi:hypothetical protein